MAPSSSLPPSKDFKPKDDELIQLFLCNKINGKPLPSVGTILECDLYGEKNPWEIWEEFEGSNSYGGKDLYFFTTLKKKFQTNCSRVVRTIGLGSWEGEDVGKSVVAPGTNQRIGLKKRFRFEKSGTDHDGAWIMHEYTIDPSLLSNPSANNYVLCRFRKNLNHNVQPKKDTNGTRKEKTKVTGEKRIIVLGVEATTEYVDKESNYKQQEDGESAMPWPELFLLQLRKINQGRLSQEEDISLLPNPFYKDLMLEMIDRKYFGSSN